MTNNYRITVKHDHGRIRIKTAASSADAAKKIVMDAEGCPERSITKIEELAE